MINQATLVGRVGKKDSKHLSNGSEMTLLSIATSKKYKDASGKYKEQTTWHNVNCFSKLAEIAKSYVNLGDLIFVQGEIQNRKIEQGERAGQYIYSLHANDIRFIANAKKKSDESKAPLKKSEEYFNFPDNEVPF